MSNKNYRKIKSLLNNVIRINSALNYSSGSTSKEFDKVIYEIYELFENYNSFSKIKVDAEKIYQKWKSLYPTTRISFERIGCPELVHAFILLGAKPQNVYEELVEWSKDKDFKVGVTQLKNEYKEFVTNPRYSLCNSFKNYGDKESNSLKPKTYITQNKVIIRDFIEKLNLPEAPRKGREDIYYTLQEVLSLTQ